MPEHIELLPRAFSTATVPARERVGFWREVFGREIVRIDIEPTTEEFEAHATFRALPSLQMGALRSGPAVCNRTSHLIADGDDGVSLIIGQRRKLHFVHRQQECYLSPQECVLLLDNEPARMQHREVEYRSIRVPRAVLADREVNIVDLPFRAFSKHADAMQMLLDYCGFIASRTEISHRLGPVISHHVHDLLGLALSARECGASSHSDGQMARLEVIKEYVKATIGHEDLSLESIAKRYSISARFIQRLFQQSGITFTEFRLEQQLVRARDMLADPKYKSSSIAAIAFIAGFGDLSYFNRAFRRRFNQTPSEMRETSQRY